MTRLHGRGGDVGQVTLMRPQALNALTTDMCIQMRQQLEAWQSDASIKAVIITAQPGRAFCAGGDIRRLFEAKGNPDALDCFFTQEYAINRLLHHYSKPYVAFMDGITMGGGVGIALHGAFSCATENFIFAMPETNIGYFTDVASGYLFNRCPGAIGYYLGLVGAQIDAHDAADFGLVTHCVRQASIQEIIDCLVQTPLDEDPFASVAELLAPFAQKITPSSLRYESVMSAFFQPTIELIIQALQQESSSLAEAALITISSRSRLSLMATLACLQASRTMTFNQVSAMDERLAGYFMRNCEFFEGVRAQIVDKDYAPSWRFPMHSRVDVAQLESIVAELTGKN